jgi:hypothetical protein
MLEIMRRAFCAMVLLGIQLANKGNMSDTDLIPLGYDECKDFLRGIQYISSYPYGPNPLKLELHGLQGLSLASLTKEKYFPVINFAVQHDDGLIHERQVSNLINKFAEDTWRQFNIHFDIHVALDGPFALMPNEIQRCSLFSRNHCKIKILSRNILEELNKQAGINSIPPLEKDGVISLEPYSSYDYLLLKPTKKDYPAFKKALSEKYPYLSQYRINSLSLSLIGNIRNQAKLNVFPSLKFNASLGITFHLGDPDRFGDFFKLEQKIDDDKDIANKRDILHLVKYITRCEASGGTRCFMEIPKNDRDYLCETINEVVGHSRSINPRNDYFNKKISTVRRKNAVVFTLFGGAHYLTGKEESQPKGKTYIGGAPSLTFWVNETVYKKVKRIQQVDHMAVELKNRFC